MDEEKVQSNSFVMLRFRIASKVPSCLSILAYRQNRGVSYVRKTQPQDSTVLSDLQRISLGHK